MKILLFTRQGKKWSNRGGGIFKSGRSICRSLKNTGDIVIDKNINLPIDYDIPKDIDLVWFYGDFDTIYNKIKHIRTKCNTPFLINSTWDNTNKRALTMIDIVNRYDNGFRDIYLAIFAPDSLKDNRLKTIKDKLIVVPKILSYESMRMKLDFKYRKGICIGEAAKLSRDILSDINIKLFLEQIYNIFPHIPLIAYRQYDNEIDLPSFVNVRKTKEKGFVDWLKQFKLFLALTNNETFYMVPIEAQIASVPVLYPNMPQSLNHYINFTGYRYNDLSDLINAIDYIYNNEDEWKKIAKSGYYNAKSKCGLLQSTQLHLTLEKIVRAFKCRR